MGTKIGNRNKPILSRFSIEGNQGNIAQLLHPYSSSRDAKQVAPLLRGINKELSHEVKLVISGGGLIEITKSSEEIGIKDKKSEEMLNKLLNIVEEEIDPISTMMKKFDRDYIIGVDVIIKNGKKKFTVGQFAVVFHKGRKRIIWKSYPAGEKEKRSLSGFGTDKGRKSPRIVSTSVGKGIILVCHDSQAYNHRGKNTAKTPRKEVRKFMDDEMNKHEPKWAFNLIHWVKKSQNLITFSTSYKQIYNDYTWKPMTIGAFGYGKKVVKDLDGLAEKVRPFQEGGTVIILEAKKN